MPWSETSTMDQKRLFIKDYLRDTFAMAELCRRYGISRPTGYKWIDRLSRSSRSVCRTDRSEPSTSRMSSTFSPVVRLMYRPPSRSPSRFF